VNFFFRGEEENRSNEEIEEKEQEKEKRIPSI
jgi:hypothetical protein